MHYGYYYNPWLHVFGGIISFLFWILIICLIIALIRRSRSGQWNDSFIMQSRRNRAIDILKERYAKGEINKQEFEEKKKDLE